MNEVEKQKAIDLLARGKTQAQTASHLGVAESTVSRWLDDTDFRTSVVESSLELWDMGGVQMSGLFMAANARALEMLNNPRTSDAQKIRIIRAVWSVAPKIFEMAQLNARIARLEELSFK